MMKCVRFRVLTPPTGFLWKKTLYFSCKLRHTTQTRFGFVITERRVSLKFSHAIIEIVNCAISTCLKMNKIETTSLHFFSFYLSSFLIYVHSHFLPLVCYNFSFPFVFSLGSLVFLGRMQLPMQYWVLSSTPRLCLHNRWFHPELGWLRGGTANPSWGLQHISLLRPW